MRAESIVFGIAGSLFGLIIGWVLGSQQPAGPGRLAAPVAQSAPAQTQGSQAVPLDAEQVKALESVAGQNPNDAQPRVQLGNLYFDAEQYNQAITWYEQALKLNPKDANVSTDLGVAYYYTNQPDRALSQFDASLRSIGTPRPAERGHRRAFGKRAAGAARRGKKSSAIPAGGQGSGLTTGTGRRNSRVAAPVLHPVLGDRPRSGACRGVVKSAGRAARAAGAPGRRR
jgi:hypothetical protein